MGNECRLRLYKWRGPALDDAALCIDGELRSLRIEHRLNELPLQALADLEGLAEQVDVALGRDLTNERHTSGGEGQRVERDIETGRQLLEFLPPAMLFWCQATQAA